MIHVAMALPVADGSLNREVIEVNIIVLKASRELTRSFLQTAVNNTMNLLHQTREAGVPRFIFTSSVTTSVDVLDPEAVFKDHTYGESGMCGAMA